MGDDTYVQYQESGCWACQCVPRLGCLLPHFRSPLRGKNLAEEAIMFPLNYLSVPAEKISHTFPHQDRR